MRTIRNYVQAEKARREESGDEGFSLIELIVVVVILGILAAVAIPIFLNLQSEAEQKAQDTVAANAATQVASNIAQDKDPELNLDVLADGKYDIVVTGDSIEDFYVTVSAKDGDTDDSVAGPGKPGTGGSGEGEEEEEE